MADYKVPGVYVEEPTGLSLSVQTGQTAVPVFAFDSTVAWGGVIGTGSAEINNSVVTAFDSWLDVVSILNKYIGGDDGKKKAIEGAVKTDVLYQSLKLYFINGGGRCYIAPVDKLEALVPQLDDVTLLVQAGSSHDNFNSHVGNLCKPGNTYFALFDSANALLSDKTSVETEQGRFTHNAYAAVYYPWLTLPGDTSTHIPPSGAVAGAYARVDRERGVWKAPANIPISGAVPLYPVSDDVDGYCNVPTVGGLSINVIRQFRGTGTLIWGARTLKSDDGHWKFIPVRRLFNAVEKDIKTAMSTAIFEPNSAPTWERVRAAVESYLYGLWKEGALQGETPKEAYRVDIGLGTTMTQAQINAGTMVLKVGLAAVRPAEFIILQLTQDVVPG